MTHTHRQHEEHLGVENYSVDISGLEVDAMVTFPYYVPWKSFLSETHKHFEYYSRLV